MMQLPEGLDHLAWICSQIWFPHDPGKDPANKACACFKKTHRFSSHSWCFKIQRETHGAPCMLLSFQSTLSLQHTTDAIPDPSRNPTSWRPCRKALLPHPWSNTLRAQGAERRPGSGRGWAVVLPHWWRKCSGSLWGILCWRLEIRDCEWKSVTQVNN